MTIVYSEKQKYGLPVRPQAFAHPAKAMICQETARMSAGRYGESLLAIILTGSLSRDEATFVEDGTGLELLGDADFLLVFRDRVSLPSSASIQLLREEIENILRVNGLRASITLGVVRSDYLRNLPPHILSYELRASGCVVWGDSEILSLTPKFSSSEISLEDAWRLLANRIIEQLEPAASSGNGIDVCWNKGQYRTVKLYLDMATSFLIFAGRYAPTYKERARELRRLAAETSETDLPFPLQPFADQVSACTSFKLDGYPLPDTAAHLWHDAVRLSQALWRWELARLTSATGQMSESELMLRWMKLQPIEARIRGWASVARKCGWRRTRTEWLRWARLAKAASPRYWVYSVGTEVFFQMPELLGREDNQVERGHDWKALAERLPLPDLPGESCGAQEWRKLAQVTARNYKLFLETTTT